MIPRALVGPWLRRSMKIKDGGTSLCDSTTRVIYLQTGCSRYVDFRVDALRNEKLDAPNAQDICGFSDDDLKVLSQQLADSGSCQVLEAPQKGIQSPSSGSTPFVDLRIPHCFLTGVSFDEFSTLKNHFTSPSYQMAELEEIPPSETWLDDAKDMQVTWNSSWNYQPLSFYPEPGNLLFLPDRMIEVAPSGAYREDWRLLSSGKLKNSNTGQSITLATANEASLILVGERDIETGEFFEGELGCLVLLGDHMAFVRDRASIEISSEQRGKTMKDLVETALDEGGREKAEKLIDCEYSYCIRECDDTFKIKLSTLPFLEQIASISLSEDDWTFELEKGQAKQRCFHRGKEVERIWLIEHME